MGKPLNIILAGFGGQGVLFAGKVVAYSGLIENREVSWLPSYGPEMRGGTANCSVCLSDEPIGSPLVTAPDALVALNQPSYDKFKDTVTKDGLIVVDTTMVQELGDVRSDIKVCAIPASQMAEEAELEGLTNVICVGKLFAETNFCQESTLVEAMEKCVPAKKQHLLEPNKKALEVGRNA